MKIIQYMTNISRRLSVMKNTLLELKKHKEVSPQSQCHYIDDMTQWDEQWKQLLKESDLVYVRWMGSAIDTKFLTSLIPFLHEWKIPFYIDAAGSIEGEVSAFVEPSFRHTIDEYATLGGFDNYKNLWRFLQSSPDEQVTITPPKKMLWAGIYRPGEKEAYDSFDVYKDKYVDESKVTIGLLFYRDEWIWKDNAYIDALVEEIEQQGMNVVPVFSNGIPDEELGIPPLTEVFQRFFQKEGIPTIDTLITTLKFSLTGTGSLTVPFLKEWNVPVLQAYSLLTEVDHWKDTFEGMNAMEVSISVSLPEFDGIIHTLPVSSKEDIGNGETRYLPIRERIASTVRKAKKWALLRRKENHEKRIAIVFHNYPPTNGTIGSAVSLDTIESVRRLMHAMKERGYVVEEPPEDTKEFIESLTSHATNDIDLLSEQQIRQANHISDEDYTAFFEEAQGRAKPEMIRDWGEPPGEVMHFDDYLLVPGTLYGNVFVTVQPPRGYGANPDKIYHSPYCAPTHQYIAFYHWLCTQWKADAVAHIGTHGSLEWLPGKNAGLGPDCYPDLALKELPNVYPYLMSITGEGIQAKRRSSACLIEHLSAPQTQAGLYDELDELEKAMDEYLHFESAQPERVQPLEEILFDKIKQAHLEEEVPFKEVEPISEYIGRLHNYISELKNLEVHTGLHILGRNPDAEQIVEYIILIMRMENGQIPSIFDAISSLYGHTYKEFLDESHLMYEPCNCTYGVMVDRVTEESRQFIQALQRNNWVFDKEGIQGELPFLQDIEEEQWQPLETIGTFIGTELAPNLLLTKQEITNMLRTFEGQYVEPGPSGAPSSGGADLLPTGRNFFGIDPRNLPTQGAWEIGRALGDQVIERFILEEGHYPESVGIVLWSGANMRSHGQCVAQFLYLMGIRPKWQAGSLRVTGLEIIPLEELGRPRVDVTARISGLFRDTLPNLSDLLDRAVQEIAQLEEPLHLNFVKKHILEDTEELVAEGIDQKDAWRQASFRIFGCPKGSYGAGVSKLLEEKNWETIDDLADVYVTWGAHAYGNEMKGEFVPKLFRKRMSTIEVTIKNEDNHETNMLSSDDYNAYHGGMIATVRSIRGKAPRSYCGDSTNKKDVALHSLQEETKRLFRSEAINPKFIEGMMKHGYKGAMDLSKYVAHSYQWDATSAVMEDWMYEKYAEKYAFDEKVQEWMKDVNPWAFKSLMSTLLEAQQRGLWNAKEDTLAQLKDLYLDLEGDIEEKADSYT